MATITTLQGSTQIGNSDEIINANFQNINNAIVEKTGAQSIAGAKTFTDPHITHDTSNNTNNPDMRYTAKVSYSKNQNDAGGIQRSNITDADNATGIGSRKRSIVGYPRKTLTGGQLEGTQFFDLEFDTYDGDSTYTKRATIKTDSFYFNNQNLTSTTSYTPVLTGDSGTGATATVLIGKYREFGDMAYVNIRLILTAKGTCSGVVYVSAPTTVSNSGTILAGGIYATGTGPNNSKGRAGVFGSSKFNFTKESASANTNRSDLAIGDEILISGRYIK